MANAKLICQKVPMSVEHPITFKSICPPGPSTRWSVGRSLRPLLITTNYFWRLYVVFASLSLAKRSISLFHRRSCPPGHDWGSCVFNLVWLLSAFLASPPSKPQTCDSFEFLFHPFLPSIQLWSKGLGLSLGFIFHLFLLAPVGHRPLVLLAPVGH